MNKETALSTLQPLKLVPTGFPAPQTEEMLRLQAAYQAELFITPILMLLGACLLLLGSAFGWLAVCALMYSLDMLPLFAVFTVWSLEALGLGAGMLSFKCLRASCEKLVPQLIADASEETELSRAALELNGHITKWNEAARLAETTPDIDSELLMRLLKKRRELQSWREKALRCLAFPTADP